jgi:hypothetical protein
MSTGELGPMLAMIFCRDKVQLSLLLGRMIFGFIFLVLTVRKDLVDSLERNKLFMAFFESAVKRAGGSISGVGSLAGRAVAVLHFCNDEVLKCSKYRRVVLNM